MHGHLRLRLRAVRPSNSVPHQAWWHRGRQRITLQDQASSMSVDLVERCPRIGKAWRAERFAHLDGKRVAEILTGRGNNHSPPPWAQTSHSPTTTCRTTGRVGQKLGSNSTGDAAQALPPLGQNRPAKGPSGASCDVTTASSAIPTQYM
jgi:hypothetical protein